MSKKTEVTVNGKTYSLTWLQANALMNGVFQFRRDGLYVQRRGGRKRPYISTSYRSGVRSATKRSLVRMKLISSDYFHPAITAQGVRVAEALWPLHHDETMEEVIQRLNAEDASRERERKDKLRTAVRGFKGIKDADGKSVAKRIRDEAGSGQWNHRLLLDLDDLAAIGQQLTDRSWEALGVTPPRSGRKK